jgi:DNA-binding MarR family transcriptional regulator
MEAAFIGLLVVAEHLQVRLEALCRRSGITHAQYNVLRILRGAHPGGHPRYEIIGRLIQRAPDVTRLLDRLESRGLIARAADGRNRRHSVARVTDRGLELLAAIDPQLMQLQQDCLAPLTIDQVRTLATMLDRLSPSRRPIAEPAENSHG